MQNPKPDSDLDLPLAHLKTPNLDFPLTGGDIAEELSWQDVLIEIAGECLYWRNVSFCDTISNFVVTLILFLFLNDLSNK